MSKKIKRSTEEKLIKLPKSFSYLIEECS